MRITFEIKDSISASDALTKLATWYKAYEEDDAPMTGVVCYRDGITLYARDYRKTPCFVAYREAKTEEPK